MSFKRGDRACITLRLFRPRPRARKIKRIELNENFKFDHEKLDVYQLELQFIAWVTPLIEEVKASAGSKVRGRFFDDARGSAAECASCLDALVAKSVCNEDRVDKGKELLHRIVSILTKLVMRFAPSKEVREEVFRYNVEDEYEDEDD